MKIPDKYILKPFQKEGVSYLKSRKYGLLADDMGLGKTIQGLSACVELGLRKILIICPASLCLQWQAICQEFYTDAGVYVLDDKYLKKFGPLWNQADILISSYGALANIQRYKKIDISTAHFDCTIIDEAHFLKNHQAKRTKAILGKGTLITKSDRVWLMTGTPVMNRPVELFTLLKTFCPELLKQYVAWPLYIRRFCGYLGKGAKNTDELSTILKDFMLRRTKEQVLDQLPAIVESRILLEGIKPVKDEYLPTQRRLISEQKISGITTFVKDILQTIDKVVLIVYHRETLKKLEEALSEFCPVSIYGGLDVKDKHERLQKFKEDPNCKLCIGQINTIGFGIDGLQHICNRIIFGEIDWSPGTLSQAIDRLRRIGQTSETVFVDYLIAKGTLEEQIEFKLDWKKKIINELTGDTERMPYAYSHEEWAAIPEDRKQNIINDPVSEHFKNNHGKQKRSWEIKEEQNKEKKEVARPKKNQEVGEALVDNVTEKLGPILTQAVGLIVKLAAQEVVKSLGGGPGGAIPVLVDQALSHPDILDDSQVAPPKPKEYSMPEVVDAIKTFLENAQLFGVSAENGMKFYKEKVIGDLGASKVSDLKPEHYALVMDRIKTVENDEFKHVKSLYKSTVDEI